MTEIKKVITKNGKIQYHEYNLRQLRSFRISAAKAELKVSSGESCLVDKFWYERTEEPQQEVKEEIKLELVEEVKQTNVVSFNDRLKAKQKEKQDKEDLEKAKTHFLEKILPNMTIDEKQQLIMNPNNFNEIMADILIRISVESIH